MGGRPLRFVHFPDPNRVRPWMQRMARERERERETGRKRRIERQGRERRGRRGRRREGGRRGRDVCVGGREVERVFLAMREEATVLRVGQGCCVRLAEVGASERARGRVEA